MFLRVRLSYVANIMFMEDFYNMPNKTLRNIKSAMFLLIINNAMGL